MADIIIYRTPDNELAVKFPSEEMRNAFMERISAQEHIGNPFNIYEDNDDQKKVLYIKAATFNEATKEFTIDFPDGHIRNAFTDILFDPTKKDDIFSLQGRKAIKIHSPNLLKPIIERGNIQTFIADAKLKPLKDIPDSIGSFSGYKGYDGENIYSSSWGSPGPRQGYLAKKMLLNLKPDKELLTSIITTIDLSEGEPKQLIEITGSPNDPGAFGEGKVTMSPEQAEKLAKSAQIMTNADFMPTKFYSEIQDQLGGEIKEGNRRTLKAILGEKRYEEWERQYESLGFKTQEAFETATSIPLDFLALNVCHSQECHAFVEQHKTENGEAVNKLRNVDLDKETPFILISTPGINFKDANPAIVDELSSDDNPIIQTLIINMWKNVIQSAKERGCEYISIGPIGMGEFFPAHWKEKDKDGNYNPNGLKASRLYWDSLGKVLSQPEYKNAFKAVHVNPGKGVSEKAFEDAMESKGYFNTGIVHFKNDIKFLAIEYAKAGARCALVNASDSDVMWAKNDIGKYYKKGHYAMEEDIGATTTASLGSAGIRYKKDNDYVNCYSDPAKMTQTTAPNPVSIIKSDKTPAAKEIMITKEDKVVAEKLRQTYIDDMTKLYDIQKDRNSNGVKIFVKLLQIMEAKESKGPKGALSLSKINQNQKEEISSALPGFLADIEEYCSDGTELKGRLISLHEELKTFVKGPAVAERKAETPKVAQTTPPDKNSAIPKVDIVQKAQEKPAVVPAQPVEAAVQPKSPNVVKSAVETTISPTAKPPTFTDQPKAPKTPRPDDPLDVSLDEWKKAKTYFDEHPTHTKMRKEDRDTVDRKGHSFIKVDGKIYAIANGVYLGKGGWGKVKIAQDEDKKRFAVKIEAKGGIEQDAELQIMKLMKYKGKSYLKGRSERKLEQEKAIFKEKIGKKVKMPQGQEIELNPVMTNTKVYTVTELIEGHDLFHELRSDEGIYGIKKLEAALKCCLEIERLHKLGIIHGDIKGLNFMINNEGEQITITPMDWGMSKILPEGQPTVRSIGGTPGYLAPEAAKSGEISRASDIYALGHMFQTEFQYFAEGVEEWNDLCKSMKNEQNPNDRPTIDEVAKSLIKLIEKHPEYKNEKNKENLEEVIKEAKSQISSPLPTQEDLDLKNKILEEFKKQKTETKQEEGTKQAREQEENKFGDNQRTTVNAILKTNPREFYEGKNKKQHVLFQKFKQQGRISYKGQKRNDQIELIEKTFAILNAPGEFTSGEKAQMMHYLFQKISEDISVNEWNAFKSSMKTMCEKFNKDLERNFPTLDFRNPPPCLPQIIKGLPSEPEKAHLKMYLMSTASEDLLGKNKPKPL